jgi:hypothetical protein
MLDYRAPGILVEHCGYRAARPGWWRFPAAGECQSAWPIVAAMPLMIACCLIAPGNVWAQGGPPMLIDDPGTPGDGRWEINTAFLEERTSTARDRSFPHVDINYGLGERIQLKYETGYLFSDGPGSNGLRHDWDDSLLGLKWRFADQDHAGVDLSIYPQLELQNSHRLVRRGVAQPAPNLFLPIEVAHAFGPVTVVSEAGYQYYSEQANEWVAGVLAGFEFSKRFELMAEIRSVSENFLNGGDLIMNLGMRLEVAAKLKILAAAGTGLRNGTDTTRFLGYLGFQVILGNRQ